MKTADKVFEYATEIRVNKYGQIDVNYYRNRAMQLRAENMAEMAALASEKAKVFLAQLALKLFGPRSIPTH